MTERKTPRFNLRFVWVAKNPSTALSHEVDVGVKWNVPSRMTIEPWRALDACEPHDHRGRRDCRSRRNLLFDGVQKADEPPMLMALRVATDHRVVQHIERGKQYRRAAWLVAVRHSPGAALLHRQSGRVRSSA